MLKKGLESGGTRDQRSKRIFQNERGFLFTTQDKELDMTSFKRKEALCMYGTLKGKHGRQILSYGRQVLSSFHMGDLDRERDDV
jgi:hypothetical protein